jgi:hypothetical protein
MVSGLILGRSYSSGERVPLASVGTSVHCKVDVRQETGTEYVVKVRDDPGLRLCHETGLPQRELRGHRVECFPGHFNSDPIGETIGKMEVFGNVF